MARVCCCGGLREIEKVTDIEAIAAAGVFVTPALAVDGELKAVGKVLSPEAIKAMLV